jgi:large subunit ribosomal protein L9
MATARNIEKFEKVRADLEAKAAAEVDAAKTRAAGIEGRELRITVQSGSEGRLFGSVGTIDIAEAFGAIGVELERSEIRLPDGPLRVVGEHMIEIHLHADVNVEVKVVLEGQIVEEVAAEAADPDEESES